MNDKILVKLVVPNLDLDFDLFIPTNEQIWKIKKLIAKAIDDMIDTNVLETIDNVTLLNLRTSEIYHNNDIVINTNIRNSTILTMLPVNKVSNLQ